jgi:ATP-binding cassette subfamily B protein
MADDRQQADGRAALQPLRALAPYILRYRGMVAAALVFLTLAAGTTLSLPLAVRRMIDHGFAGADPTFIATYSAS